jgi:hypothetical protein
VCVAFITPAAKAATTNQKPKIRSTAITWFYSQSLQLNQFATVNRLTADSNSFLTNDSLRSVINKFLLTFANAGRRGSPGPELITV